MAVSEVSICNLAISWLAGNLIISLDDEIVEAQLCKANYELARDAVLESIAWTFATKRYYLTPELDVPAWGYAKQFTIPAEVITVLEVTDDSTSPNGSNGLDWRRESNRILCDSDAIYIKAIYKEEDPARYPPNFVQAVAARLASEIAIPLTESMEMMITMESKFKDRLVMAGVTDGVQGKSDVFQSTVLTGKRV